MLDSKGLEYKVDPYDKRTGIYWAQGDDWGKGKPQPVGSKKVNDKNGVPIGCFSKPIEK